VPETNSHHAWYRIGPAAELARGPPDAIIDDRHRFGTALKLREAFRHGPHTSERVAVVGAELGQPKRQRLLVKLQGLCFWVTGFTSSTS
jgi:hypothetical protein